MRQRLAAWLLTALVATAAFCGVAAISHGVPRTGSGVVLVDGSRETRRHTQQELKRAAVEPRAARLTHFIAAGPIAGVHHSLFQRPPPASLLLQP